MSSCFTKELNLGWMEGKKVVCVENKGRPSFMLWHLVHTELLQLAASRSDAVVEKESGYKALGSLLFSWLVRKANRLVLQEAF